jgi:hypothetical protein
MPKETWPLIFIYFTKENASFPVDKLWVHRSTTTMDQIRWDSDFYKRKRAYTVWCEVVKDKYGIRKALRAYIEKANPEKFIINMHLLRFHASYEAREFNIILAEALSKAKIQKHHFIAQCLVAMKSDEFLFKGEKNLAEQLLKPPFLNDELERTRYWKKCII